ncbi:uncharacterized protein GGS22DRAFT_54677 [Annulohypoxylon maeteangense]|uniref:uncharacterized protein n=1 Tax=Annulohypoxylon maeteangense TaxID=1927788 RepID=UPI002007460C|nr:uncharacterized protein GGS22DRAFT_54677 [Annulohypoxylon maeteangense]KAI0881659.1 hypothetical protein GGS22DRAFT_54677 [Annulohypoxylon maeteangense]
MATVTNRSTDKTIVLYQKGQRWYKATQYDHAEKAFLRVMGLCSCGVNIQKQPRIDHDILSGIKKKDLKGVLAKLPASERCGSRLHLDALDSLIAVYEMQNRLDDALEFALKMVNLSPRDPKSYLRLGKVLRLKNQPTTAYHNYKQGIELTKRKNPNHALLPKLQAQKDNVFPLATFDPIVELPIELVEMIFRFFNIRAKVCCLGVSKTWKTVLTSDSLRSLWKTQDYTFTRLKQLRAPSLFTSFVNNWRYGGESITELSVDGCAQFLMTGKLERLFRFFHDLKVLKLREPQAVLCLEELRTQPKMPKLKHLFLGRGVQPSVGLLRQLLVSSSTSLEELSIFTLPPPFTHWPSNWPRLEKLKVVRLAQSYGIVADTRLSRIVESAPNVEEAWLDFQTHELVRLMYDWPRLQSIFIGQHVISNADSLPPGGPIPFVTVHERLRELHLEIGSTPANLQLIMLKAHSCLPFFQKMEKLSVLVASNAYTGFTSNLYDLFNLLVRPGLESGTLREVHFDPLPVGSFFGDPQVPTIPDWFKSDSVTYLNLTGFTRDGLHGDRLLEDVVLGIASRFPNLSAVDVSNEPFPDTVLAKLIQRGVKTIYCRPAQPKVDLRNWASRKFKAQIILGQSPHVPAYHPDRCQNSASLPRIGIHM